MRRVEDAAVAVAVAAQRLDVAAAEVRAELAPRERVAGASSRSDRPDPGHRPSLFEHGWRFLDRMGDHGAQQDGRNVVEFVGSLWGIETIAAGREIRALARLQRTYGKGRWRKRKGFAVVRIPRLREVFSAEVHWYEATGIGRRELKIKRRLE